MLSPGIGPRTGPVGTCWPVLSRRVGTGATLRPAEAGRSPGTAAPGATEVAAAAGKALGVAPGRDSPATHSTYAAAPATPAASRPTARRNRGPRGGRPACFRPIPFRSASMAGEGSLAPQSSGEPSPVELSPVGRARVSSEGCGGRGKPAWSNTRKSDAAIPSWAGSTEAVRTSSRSAGGGTGDGSRA